MTMKMVYFVGELMPSVINIRGSLISAVLTFSFTPNGFASLQCGSTGLPLPETVLIQWRDVQKLRRITKEQHKVSAMLLDDYGICYPLPSRTNMSEARSLNDFEF